MENIKLPNFLFVGAGKTGSTWIFKALDAHPEVFVPPAKELYFFTHHYDKGYRWYARFFSEADSSVKALGELTPGYLYYRDAAERIVRDLPGVKIFACVRNPIERAVSAYQFKIRNGIAGPDFASTMRKFPEILERGKYAEHIRVYHDLFGWDNFKVFLHDDLKHDPIAFGREIYRFIGVDTEFNYRSANERVLPAAQPRSALFAALVYRMSRVAHGLGWIKLIGVVRNSALSKVLYQPVDKVSKDLLNEDEMSWLREYFYEDVKSLEALLNRDLQHWLQ